MKDLTKLKFNAWPASKRIFKFTVVEFEMPRSLESAFLTMDGDYDYVQLEHYLRYKKYYEKSMKQL